MTAADVRRSLLAARVRLFPGMARAVKVSRAKLRAYPLASAPWSGMVLLCTGDTDATNSPAECPGGGDEMSELNADPPTLADLEAAVRRLGDAAAALPEAGEVRRLFVLLMGRPWPGEFEYLTVVANVKGGRTPLTIPVAAS